MTGLRWRKTTEEDNDGHAMPVWRRGDYLISANVGVWENGRLVRWDFELTVMERGEERFVSAHRSLDAAKKAATDHEKSARL